MSTLHITTLDISMQPEATTMSRNTPFGFDTIRYSWESKKFYWSNVYSFQYL